ncbi:hypothetical protein BC833DRAFT_616930 [Globomyces pollinis-pini]|nr:hypothetical protein BC833DRAFT_616930 [Globomyces pollinis-pini]
MGQKLNQMDTPKVNDAFSPSLNFANDNSRPLVSHQKASSFSPTTNLTSHQKTNSFTPQFGNSQKNQNPNAFADLLGPMEISANKSTAINQIKPQIGQMQNYNQPIVPNGRNSAYAPQQSVNNNSGPYQAMNQTQLPNPISQNQRTSQVAPVNQNVNNNQSFGMPPLKPNSNQTQAKANQFQDLLGFDAGFKSTSTGPNTVRPMSATLPLNKITPASKPLNQNDSIDDQWGKLSFLENPVVTGNTAQTADVFDLDFLGQQKPTEQKSPVTNFIKSNPSESIQRNTNLSTSKKPEMFSHDRIEVLPYTDSSPSRASPASAPRTPNLSVEIDQLVKMGFDKASAEKALKENDFNVELAADALLNEQPTLPSDEPPVPYTEADIQQLLGMGFKKEPAKNALLESEGDVELAIELLVKRNAGRRVSFSLNEESKTNIIDTSKIAETASQFGLSVFKGAKDAFEFSKKKVLAMANNKENQSSSKPINEESWSKTAYKDTFDSSPTSQKKASIDIQSKWTPTQHKDDRKSPEKSIPSAQKQIREVESVESIETPLERNRKFDSKDTKAENTTPVVDLLGFHSEPNANIGKDTISLLGNVIDSKPAKVSVPFSKNLQTSAPKPVAATDPLSIQTNEVKEKGNEFFKKGQFGDAEVQYTKAIEMLPSNHPSLVVLYNNRAGARLKTGDYRGVVADCELVLTKEENDVKCLLRRATAYEALEQWEKARDDYKKIMGLDSNTKGCSLGLSRCLAALQPKQTLADPVTPKVMSAAVKNAVDQAVQKLRDANEAVEQEEAEKFALHDTVNDKIEAWKSNKETNIRALISSLENVLWVDSGWKPVSIGELITPNQVKVKYMRAVAKVHPDKVGSGATTEQRLIATSVFSVLNKAWDDFKTVNNMQ